MFIFIALLINSMHSYVRGKQTSISITSIIMLNQELLKIQFNQLIYPMTAPKRERVLKDFHFMIDMPKQVLADDLIKRFEKEGSGLIIQNINIPFDVYITYDKYDYEGRLINSIYNAKAKLSPLQATENSPPGIAIAIKSMKLGQTSWYNARSFGMHMTENLIGGGCHFHLTISDIKYKNEESMAAKRSIVERNKQEGRKLFYDKDFHQAMKIYKGIINISEGLDPKKFNKEQLIELEKINLNGKKNYMKCFCKIKSHEEKTIKQAEQFTSLFLKLEGETEETLYFKGYTLMHSRFLTEALEVARKLYLLNQEQGQKLFDTVKRWKKNKRPF